MNEIYTERAKRLVRQYIIKHLDKSDPMPKFEVYVVWFAYTLGNWKALLSSTLFDGMYYEVTYNTAKYETYLDAYKKFENVCIPDGADLNVDPEPTLPFQWPVIGKVKTVAETEKGLEVQVEKWPVDITVKSFLDTENMSEYMRVEYPDNFDSDQKKALESNLEELGFTVEPKEGYTKVFRKES